MIDHCHCPLLRSKVVFGRELWVKKSDLRAVLGYNNRSYLRVLTPFYTSLCFFMGLRLIFLKLLRLIIIPGGHNVVTVDSIYTCRLRLVLFSH